MATADARQSWFDPRPIVDSTNWVTVAFAGVMLLVQSLALLFAISGYDGLNTARDSAPPVMQTPSYAGYLIVVLVVEVVALVALIHFYEWLPDIVQRLVRWTLTASIVAGGSAVVYLTGGWIMVAVLYILWAGCYYTIRWLNLELLLMNSAYILIFAVLGTAAGTVLSIDVVLAFIAGLAVLDYIEVKTGWMMYFVKKTASIGFTPAIIIPSKLRPEFDDFSLNCEDRPDWVVAILGGGDLAIPAIFMVTAFLEFGGRFPTLGILLGALVGVVLADHEFKTTEEAQPALVFIIPCVLAGYIVTGLLSGLTPMQLLGGA